MAEGATAVVHTDRPEWSASKCCVFIFFCYLNLVDKSSKVQQECAFLWNTKKMLLPIHYCGNERHVKFDVIVFLSPVLAHQSLGEQKYSFDA